MTTKSLFVSLIAGAMVASGAAFAADMPVKAKPVSTSPWVLDLHGSFDYNFANTRDLPPLKWSSLKYVLNTEDWTNGEEEEYG